MQKRINLSDFPFYKIYVLIEKKFRILLINNAVKKLNCKNYFDLSLIINKKFKKKFNGGDLKYWVEGEKLDKRTGVTHKKFMPLWLLSFLVGIIDKDINDFQDKIISYRCGGKGLIINEPKLPINVNPELDSIVTHLFADGAAGDYTPSYTQKNKHSFENFIKKLENCFGKFDKSIYFTQGKNQIKFPKAITDILSKYYKISSYSTYEAEIPKEILEAEDLKRKLACIVSFIVDEGYVRDVVVLYSANKKLLFGIRQLVLDCGYICSNLQYNQRARSYLFTLSNKTLGRFYYDVLQLSKKFLTCNLSFKDNSVKFILQVIKNENPRDSKITCSLITSTLKEKELTAKEISRLTSYAYCTILHRLQDMLSKGIVERKRASNKTYLWSLTEFLGK